MSSGRADTVAPALRRLAERTIWFKDAEAALRRPHIFLAYLMTYGTDADIGVARRHFRPRQFKAALRRAPAGIFDARSWAYWHLVCDLWPPPPLPRRRLPGTHGRNARPASRSRGRERGVAAR